ncbi:DUF5133 domain-containing protein [Streptomyces sp. WAC06614]|uniref:DUF5133 domain-containing protein n=1 Tax=Streptomyces sp. WAC06614 TaxID=2487416 RepID=UPI000F7BA7D2|nr:DUF5133 domain-containing protein [Streptomyces sp. WAC06614]RSS82085.1 DUF5133 domain-containing protein [Streptomyces sp. WAC06614]
MTQPAAAETGGPAPVPAGSPEPDPDGTTTRTDESHAVPMAVGMVMALTGASARTARAIVSATAATAGLSVPEVAHTLVTRGLPVTGRVGRALRQSVRLARSTPGGAPVPVLRLAPDRGYTAKVLDRFLACHAVAATTPSDEEAQRALDDAAYTLCVLMARRTPKEAVRAARRYLAATQAPDPGPGRDPGRAAEPASAPAPAPAPVSAPRP